MGIYKIILFDLDGTLSDSKVGITKSVQYALEKLGIIETDLDRLEPFIGPPLRETFSRHYAFDEDTVKKAIRYYQERYKVTGMPSSTLPSQTNSRTLSAAIWTEPVPPKRTLSRIS